jgi:single-strand DNA-binding protein
MNTLKNTVSLIGRLGKDPMISNLNNGNKLVRFTVATNDAYKNKAGEWVNSTEWHSIKAWGKTAELCEKLLKKGTEVVLEGKLETDQYETKEGEKRSSTAINLREFMLLSKKEEEAK